MQSETAMKYRKLEFVWLLLFYLLNVTDAQRACPDDQIRIYVRINQIQFTCCVPRAVRTTARCTTTGDYVTVSTTPPMTTLRLITDILPVFTRPIVTADILTTTEQTTTVTTSTTATQTTTQPIPTTITTVPETTTPGNDEEEASGDETNLGTVGEGHDEQNTTSTGLSIGLPLAVLAVVVVAVLLVRVRYKRKKELNGDTNQLPANGRFFVKPQMGGDIAANYGEYQDFEQNVRTSPPQDTFHTSPQNTYDSLHLYGNTAEPPNTYEQVPEKRDHLSYESLHVYSNSQIGQSDYDIPTSRPMYANLKVQIQK